jgi:RNA polymerase sigma-70 factor (ECF subfamily)
LQGPDEPGRRGPLTPPVTFLRVKRLKGTRGDPGGEVVSAELVERCRRGDERAWAELVEATHREVYTLCLRILRDPDDAAEATQDAFLKAYRGLKGFRGEAQFSTWLYRVATNAAITKHRGRKRRRTFETGVEDETLLRVPSSVSVEDAAGAKVEVRELETALASLPDVYREAVMLRDVYEMSIEEIAGQLKISETAAKVRVHRGRKKLKEMIRPQEDE